MDSLYKNLNEKKFKIIAIICAFFSDLVIAKYIWTIFTDKALFEKYFVAIMDNMKKSPDFDDSMVPKDFFSELFQIWSQSLVLLLLAVIGVHIINYYLYHKDKVFAFKYLKMQSWLGGICFVILGLPKIFSGSLYLLVFISGLGLLYTACGLQIFRVKSPAPRSSSFRG
jgi:hypothetical protein